ncbi:hypothetical protein SAMN05421833_12818 [Microbispora rosea]|uniref:Uncharacterized protein n=1 Tax=Microbispora rosea TaxID=58117 RepID=A0A1N7GDV7_9ACTN|nr:hypothetical protein SAMN05421833_12818 [Microbispora rosea]
MFSQLGVCEHLLSYISDKITESRKRDELTISEEICPPSHPITLDAETQGLLGKLSIRCIIWAGDICSKLMFLSWSKVVACTRAFGCHCHELRAHPSFFTFRAYIG